MPSRGIRTHMHIFSPLCNIFTGLNLKIFFFFNSTPLEHLWNAAMTSPMCEDGGLLREWAPLNKLLQQIPLKAQNGLFTQDVNFTCIDVVTEFIAVGTNHGLVYWYGREKGDLQRLRCEVLGKNICSLQKCRNL